MMIFFVIMTVLLIFGINSILNFVGLMPGLIPSGSLGDKKLFTFFYLINLWNVLLSVIIGMNCLKSDINSGVILQILSFPIKRRYLLFSRILGSTAIVLAYYFLAFILAVIVFTFSTHEGVFFNFKMILGLIPTGALIISTITFTVLLSLYLSKIQSLFAGLVSMLFMAHYNVFFTGLNFSESLSEVSFFRIIGLITHFLFPRIGVFDELSKDLILGNALDINLWIEIPHFFLSYGLLVWICYTALNKKEF